MYICYRLGSRFGSVGSVEKGIFWWTGEWRRSFRNKCIGVTWDCTKGINFKVGSRV